MQRLSANFDFSNREIGAGGQVYGNPRRIGLTEFNQLIPVVQAEALFAEYVHSQDSGDRKVQVTLDAAEIRYKNGNRHCLKRAEANFGHSGGKSFGLSADGGQFGLREGQT